ncbi:hypothetical protein EKO17_21195 [Enterobacter hormaechei subsp. xiangfangensis]|nr:MULTISPECIES: hypothetical protein [Enterobacter]MBA7754770.1 hypothetical protein [Enterobacter sp. RHBSTW-01064]MCM7910276.1 hypothetical protein [Enterobacter hormaechei]RTM58804.1 hypothetical protein EKO17_21195 [Enterobacter hormaechei subsp. xiangfangensis]
MKVVFLRRAMLAINSLKNEDKKMVTKLVNDMSTDFESIKPNQIKKIERNPRVRIISEGHTNKIYAYQGDYPIRALFSITKGVAENILIVDIALPDQLVAE